jgi:CDP-6-deoxy-D-xylo-4-hexulose-3-dehydrase
MTEQTKKATQLRQQILDLSAQYFSTAFPPAEFKPGQSPVPVSGKVIDGGDLSSVVDSALDCWFTTGRFAEEFERKLARFVGVRCASLVNSGSSANLLAVSALTSPKLGDRRLNHGEPNSSKPPRTCLRGCRVAHLRDRCQPARSCF